MIEMNPVKMDSLITHLEQITLGPVETGQGRLINDREFTVSAYGTLEYVSLEVWTVEYSQ